MIGWLKKLFVAPVPDELGDLRVATGIFVKRALKDGLSYNEDYSLEVFDCTLNGVPVGSWQFTVRRIHNGTAKAAMEGGGDG